MTTIITKNGSGAPTAGQLSQGELAVDLTNKELYTKDSGGNVIKVGAQGGSTGTFTDLTATSSFTSPGIDDNATDTTLSISSSNRVSVGNGNPGGSFQMDVYSGTGSQAVFRARQAGSTNGFTILGDGSEYTYQMLDGDLGIVRSANTGTAELKIGGSADANARQGSIIKDLETYDLTIRNQNNEGVEVGNFIFKNGAAEFMRINNFGNVGIGTTNPTEALTVNGTGYFFNSAAEIRMAPENAIGLDFGASYASIPAAQNHGYVATGAASAGGANGDLLIAPRTSAATSVRFITGTSPTEVMRINSIGNVGIGTDSPAGNSLTIQKTGTARLRLAEEGVRAWDMEATGGDWRLNNGTNSIEAMRVDSSGNLLVGATAAIGGASASTIQITHSTAQNGLTVKNSGNARYYIHAVETSTGNYAILNDANVGVKITNGASAWSAFSDETLKENISDIGPVLDTIKDFRCVNYSLKATESDAADKVGFIAQDWEHTFPNVVTKDEDGTLSMKYTETIPVLLKAIQEQQAMIETLQAEVAALKGA